MAERNRLECDDCLVHGQLQQQVDFNYLNSDKRLEKLEVKTENNENEIAKRIPVVHFLTIVGCFITVLVSIIGLQIVSNRRTSDYLMTITKELSETKGMLESHQREEEHFSQLLNEIRKLREKENELRKVR